MAFKMKGDPMARNFGIGKHGVNLDKAAPGIKRDEGNTDLADGRSGSSPFQKVSTDNKLTAEQLAKHKERNKKSKAFYEKRKSEFKKDKDGVYRDKDGKSVKERRKQHNKQKAYIEHMSNKEAQKKDKAQYETKK